MAEIALIALDIERVGALRLDKGELTDRIADAVQMWPERHQSSNIPHFGGGQLLSVGPADAPQIVVVSEAGGVRVSEAREVDPAALSEMAACLERHGYKVTRG